MDNSLSNKESHGADAPRPLHLFHKNGRAIQLQSADMRATVLVTWYLLRAGYFLVGSLRLASSAATALRGPTPEHRSA